MRPSINILIAACSLTMAGGDLCQGQSSDTKKSDKSQGPIQIRIEAQGTPNSQQATQIQVEVHKQSQQTGSGKAKQSSVSTSGKIVIVGPDGKRREFSIGQSGSKDKSIPDQIKHALKKAGVDIQLHGLLDGPQQGQRRVIVIDPKGLGKKGKSPSGTTVIKRAVVIPAVTQRLAIGIQFAPPSAALRAQLGLKPKQGLLVQRVLKNMPAAKAGLRTFDVIVRVNGKPLTGVEQFQSAIKRAGNKGTVKLDLIRQGKPLSFAVQPAKSQAATLITGKEQSKVEGTTPKTVDVHVIKIEAADLLNQQQLQKIAPELKKLNLGPGTIRLQVHAVGKDKQPWIVAPGVKGVFATGSATPDLKKQLQRLQKQIDQLQKQVGQLQSQNKTGK
ncbi:MAG: PDZ domain-containing protein [Planctomycetaceae bacterium]